MTPKAVRTGRSCRVRGCQRKPLFGHTGKSQATHCVAHRQEGSSLQEGYSFQDGFLLQNGALVSNNSRRSNSGSSNSNNTRKGNDIINPDNTVSLLIGSAASPTSGRTCQTNCCWRKPVPDGHQRLTAHCPVNRNNDMLDDDKHRPLCESVAPKPCPKQPSLRWPGRGKEILCGASKQVGMVHVRTCEHEECRRRVPNGLGEERLRFCAVHSQPDVIVLAKQACEMEGCTVSPRFGFVGYRPRFCVSHCQPGMVNVEDERGELISGTTQPTCSFPDDEPHYCSNHELKKTEDVSHRLYQHSNCTCVPSQGGKGTKAPVFCLVHCQEGIINLTREGMAAINRLQKASEWGAGKSKSGTGGDERRGGIVVALEGAAEARGGPPSAPGKDTAVAAAVMAAAKALAALANLAPLVSASPDTQSTRGRGARENLRLHGAAEAQGEGDEGKTGKKRPRPTSLDWTPGARHNISSTTIPSSERLFQGNADSITASNTESCSVNSEREEKSSVRVEDESKAEENEASINSHVLPLSTNLISSEPLLTVIAPARPIRSVPPDPAINQSQRLPSSHSPLVLLPAAVPPRSADDAVEMHDTAATVAAATFMVQYGKKSSSSSTQCGPKCGPERETEKLSAKRDICNFSGPHSENSGGSGLACGAGIKPEPSCSFRPPARSNTQPNTNKLDDQNKGESVPASSCGAITQEVLEATIKGRRGGAAAAAVRAAEEKIARRRGAGGRRGGAATERRNKRLRPTNLDRAVGRRFKIIDAIMTSSDHLPEGNASDIATPCTEGCSDESEWDEGSNIDVEEAEVKENETKEGKAETGAEGFVTKNIGDMVPFPLGFPPLPPPTNHRFMAIAPPFPILPATPHLAIKRPQRLPFSQSPLALLAAAAPRGWAAESIEIEAMASVAAAILAGQHDKSSSNCAPCVPEGGTARKVQILPSKRVSYGSSGPPGGENGSDDNDGSIGSVRGAYTPLMASSSSCPPARSHSRPAARSVENQKKVETMSGSNCAILAEAALEPTTEERQRTVAAARGKKGEIRPQKQGDAVETKRKNRVQPTSLDSSRAMNRRMMIDSIIASSKRLPRGYGNGIAAPHTKSFWHLPFNQSPPALFPGIVPQMSVAGAMENGFPFATSMCSASGPVKCASTHLVSSPNRRRLTQIIAQPAASKVEEAQNNGNPVHFDDIRTRAEAYTRSVGFIEAVGTALTCSCVLCGKDIAANDRHVLSCCGHGLLHKACSSVFSPPLATGELRLCPKCKNPVLSSVQIFM